MVDIFASPDQRDLGGLATDIEGIIAKARATLPRGTTIDLRGQVDTMRTSFTRLGLGMIFAVVLVYLVMAVNFQSWLDPFIILMALPGAMAGMLWMLYLTRTTLSVPALMGAIMGIGVATANSILLVTFANDERATGKSADRVRSFGGVHANPAGYDDGARDDHRYASDGICPWRRRRAECSAGEGGDRRPFVRDAHHSVLRPDYLHAASKEGAGGHGSPDRRRSRGDSQAMSETKRIDRGLAPGASAGCSRPSRRGAAVYFLGYLPRERTTKQLDAAAAIRRITPPLVNAAVVKRAAASTQLTLPGNITPITEAYIYARAAGYLKQRYVDIGDRVHAGQKLADIEAPDLDQQVSQARAALAQAQGQLGQAQATLEQLTATRDLAEITWQRYKILTADGAVSRQDGDNQSTAAKTSAANVFAQQKTVRATEEYRSRQSSDVGPIAGAARLRAHHRAL